MLDLLIAIILGIVEGITEFLPVSSTGHPLLCERWMGIDLDNSELWKTFAIFIQIGAIFAVVVYFRRRILDLLMGKAEGSRTPLEISQAAKSTAAKPVQAPLAMGQTQGYTVALDEDLTPPAQRINAILMVILATIPVLIVGFLL